MISWRYHLQLLWNQAIYIEQLINSLRLAVFSKRMTSDLYNANFIIANFQHYIHTIATQSRTIALNNRTQFWPIILVIHNPLSIRMHKTKIANKNCRHQTSAWQQQQPQTIRLRYNISLRAVQRSSVWTEARQTVCVVRMHAHVASDGRVDFHYAAARRWWV